MPDIIGVLTGEHRQVDEKFEQLEALGQSGPPEERNRLLEEIVALVVPHSRAEEEVVYPVVAEHVPHGDDKAHHGEEEHRAVDEMLTKIESVSQDDQGFEALVLELVKLVREHVTEEEGQVLPGLRSSLNDEHLAELGERYLAAKERLATHTSS